MGSGLIPTKPLNWVYARQCVLKFLSVDFAKEDLFVCFSSLISCLRYCLAEINDYSLLGLVGTFTAIHKNCTVMTYLLVPVLWGDLDGYQMPV